MLSSNCYHFSLVSPWFLQRKNYFALINFRGPLTCLRAPRCVCWCHVLWGRYLKYLSNMGLGELQTRLDPLAIFDNIINSSIDRIHIRSKKRLHRWLLLLKGFFHQCKGHLNIVFLLISTLRPRVGLWDVLPPWLCKWTPPFLRTLYQLQQAKSK